MATSAELEMGDSRPIISLIVPCFNEEQVIGETHSRLCELIENQADYNFEVLFVDDGSYDSTPDILRELAEANSSICVILFSRNFGHQLAVTAGIDAARGDAVVLLDADLQDPPEVVPEMLAKWGEGYQVVYGVRSAREGESRFKLWSAHLYYRILNFFSDTAIPLDAGDFRLMDRVVVDTLRNMDEYDRFIRGMVSWVGFRQFPLPYRRAARFAGKTKYPFRKMVRFASNGIVSFSTRPLRLAAHAGLACAGLAGIGIIWALAVRVFANNWVPGWTAIIIAVFFLGGIQLVCTGILGEYIGRIYMQSKNRPLYVVRERIGRTSDTCGPPHR